MTEQETLLIMTLMALMGKPVSVDTVREVYEQQKKILEDSSRTAEPVQDLSQYQQKGVRILGMGGE